MILKHIFPEKTLLVCLFALLQFVLNALYPVYHTSTVNVFGDPAQKGAVRGMVYNQGDSTSTYITLDNGMEFVLIENHSNPMIASVIAVKTGSKNESLDDNGVSHMLEHLLFNGTKNRTQEEIYDQMDFYGGYNNAHTSKDFTNFMILLPAEHIDKGLDIQADMLFNSTIPEEKLEKEKGIVIEEIGKDMDQEGYINNIFFDRKLYEGTAYALPVLGTVSAISNLTRSQIVSYYNRYYVPNNMIGLVIGDFDTSAMVKKLKKYFGHYPPKAIPSAKRLKLNSLKNNNIYHIKGDVTKKYISIGIKGPALDDPDFFPFTVLNIWLNNNDYLMPGRNTDEKKDKTEKKTDASGISHIHSEYVSNNDIGALNIFAVLPTEANAGNALHNILLNLNEISNRLSITPEDIRGIKTKIKTEEFFLKERMHYYGMSKAEMLVSGGYQFMESYISNIERVTLKQVKRAARRYLAVDTARFYRRTGRPGNVTYVAAIVEPLEVEPFGEADDASVDAQGGPSLNDKVSSTPDRLLQGIEAQTQKIIKKRVFPNGLTLITNENNDSRVFAAHLLFKNRSFHEPGEKTGIADCLHRLLLRGTTAKDENEIERLFNAIGARVAVSDNPYIPYDDYQTSSQFSFIRLETIDDFYGEGLDLLADLILNPRLDPEKIEEVKRNMINIINDEDSSVHKTARNLFYENLFHGTSLSKKVTGSAETVSSINRDDLTRFHKGYFSPNNMIINIVSNVSDEVLANKINELFGGLDKDDELKTPDQIKPNPISGINEINLKGGKEQSYIYLGYPIAHINEQDHAPIAVLSSILANDMAYRLREKEGLAYSLGCSIQTQNSMGWFQCNLGTRKKNVGQARDGIIKILNEYQTREFDQREVEKNVNKLKGTMMMRRLPRINQAYYAGIYEFYKDDYDYDNKFLRQLNTVTPDDVKRVAELYLQSGNYIQVVIE